MGEASVEHEVKKKQENKMREIRIEKIAVNCSVGESGAQLERATKIIESLTGQRPQARKAKMTIRTFGIQKGEPTAVRVTLRKKAALEFLSKALKAVDNSLKAESFDEGGNVSFGIQEHLDIPGTKYDPSLRIIGMDVCICLSRPGLRVSKRRRATSRIGRGHRVTTEEAKKFLAENFDVKIKEAGS